MLGWKREKLCVCVRERDRDRERVCVSEREQESDKAKEDGWKTAGYFTARNSWSSSVQNASFSLKSQPQVWMGSGRDTETAKLLWRIRKRERHAIEGDIQRLTRAELSHCTSPLIPCFREDDFNILRAVSYKTKHTPTLWSSNSLVFAQKSWKCMFTPQICIWMLIATFGTPLQYSCLENPMDGGAW